MENIDNQLKQLKERIDEFVSNENAPREKSWLTYHTAIIEYYLALIKIKELKGEK